MKLSTTVDEMRGIRKVNPLEDKEKGKKLLIEIDNGRGSDTSTKERPSKS